MTKRESTLVWCMVGVSTGLLGVALGLLVLLTGEPEWRSDAAFERYFDMGAAAAPVPRPQALAGRGGR